MNEDTQDHDKLYEFALWVDNPASPYAYHNVPEHVREQVELIDDAESRRSHVQVIRDFEDGNMNPREFARYMVESPHVEPFDPFNPRGPTGSTVEVTVERSLVDGISYDAVVDMPEDVEEAKDAYRHDGVFRTFVDTYAKDRPTDDPDTFFERHAGNTVRVDAERMGYDRETLDRRVNDPDDDRVTEHGAHEARQTPAQGAQAEEEPRRPNVHPFVKFVLVAFVVVLALLIFQALT